MHYDTQRPISADYRRIGMNLPVPNEFDGRGVHCHSDNDQIAETYDDKKKNEFSGHFCVKAL